ncbi:MAG: phosphoenolpyruvate carboxykinase (ATP), partial [Rhodospirillales bacterium]
MSNEGHAISSFGLDKNGINTSGTARWNLGSAQLVETAVSRNEGKLSKDGALVCITGQHTGRSPNDKFIVKDA